MHLDLALTWRSMRPFGHPFLYLLLKTNASQKAEDERLHLHACSYYYHAYQKRLSLVVLPRATSIRQMAAGLFDIAPQLWPYLDEYDRIAFRSISRDGRHTHDCLLEHLCIHDLWGRQVDASPAEMASGIRGMLRRGCRPRALVLRFQGPAREQEHLARG